MGKVGLRNKNNDIINTKIKLPSQLNCDHFSAISIVYGRHWQLEPIWQVPNLCKSTLKPVMKDIINGCLDVHFESYVIKYSKIICDQL